MMAYGGCTGSLQVNGQLTIDKGRGFYRISL